MRQPTQAVPTVSSTASQSSHPSLYQGGDPQLGLEFSQVGSSKQTEREFPWIPGLDENTLGTHPPQGPSLSDEY